MRIVHLQADNFKRLRAVEISPEGNVVTIGGKNGHGKSSVLDAIYVALKGRAVNPPRPIRKGEEICDIRLDMGELIVTRRFRSKDDGADYTDSLKVETPDGLRHGNPQAVLNELLGEIGFDPFEFVSLDPKKQAARLLQMVPLSIDLDEFAEKDQSDFANRRDTNREVQGLRAQVEAIPKEDVPGDAPDREKIADELANAAETNAEIERQRAARAEQVRRAEAARTLADNAEQAAADRRMEAERLDEQAKQHKAEADRIEAEQAELPALDAPADTEALRQKLRTADTTLAAIDRQNRRAALAVELAEKEKESEAFTDAMKTRAKERNAALAAAKMPVEGLAFALNEKGEPVLMYDGLPFDKDQISTAAQLRVSTAIGMAANPTLRVLRIKDGSLLDEDSMKMLADMADDEDFQLWIEVVGDGGVGFIMEDGAVRGAPEPDQAEEKPKAKPKGDPASGQLDL